MADRVTTGLYEFDPHGTNPDNHVTGEVQSLQTPGLDDFYFIIPFAAPFFVDSLQLFNHQNNQPYQEGTDYLVGHYFVEAMESTGRPIAGSIRFLRRNITGIVRLNYRTLGGQWGFNDQAILTELSNRQFNPLIRSWGMIDVLPVSFPPLPHDQSIDDLVGSDDLLEGLEEIAAAIEASGEGTTSQHLEDFDNPHQVTKAQVGLSQLENYPVSTEPQARDGTSNAVYMTARRTAQAIETQALTPLQNHVGDTGNPHEVNKAQVGLGAVENFPISSAAEAIDPSRNDRYMTPYTVSLVVQSGGLGQQLEAIEQLITDHTTNLDNPHEVTAQQLNAYTKPEVDQLLLGFQADDTSRFDGMTGVEWRATLPSFDDIEAILVTLQDEYALATGTISGVSTTIELPADVPVALAMYGGADRYVISLTNGRAVAIPTDGVWGEDLEGLSERFYSRPNASYYVLPEGTIRAVGSAAITPPAAYVEGSTPSVPATTVVALQNSVYVLLNDDTVMRYTAGSSSIVYSDVSEIYSGMFGPERTILVDDAGRGTAVGDDNYGVAMTAVLDTLPPTDEIASVVILDDETYVLFEDGRLRAWSQTLVGGNYVMNALTLPIEQANNINRISGVSTHVAIMTGDGVLYFRGNNDHGQMSVDASIGPFHDVVACDGFTITRTAQGQTHYWGDAPDNRYLPPASFRGVV